MQERIDDRYVVSQDHFYFSQEQSFFETNANTQRRQNDSVFNSFGKGLFGHLFVISLCFVLLGFHTNAEAIPKPSRTPSTQPTLPHSLPVMDFGFPKLNAKKRKPHKRRKRRKKTTKFEPPKLPKDLGNNAVGLYKTLGLLNIKDWRIQRSLIGQITKLKGQTQRVLRMGLSHKQLRVKLLTAHILAARKDTSAIPMLIRTAIQMYDQPTPLLMGALLAYGPLAAPAILKAIPQTQHPHVLIRTLGFLRIKAGLPLLVHYITHQNPKLRAIAREAAQQYSTAKMTDVVELALKRKTTAEIRSNLLRMLGYRPTAKGCGFLLRALRDKSGSIRFLARITLEDQATILHQKQPKKVTKPPTSKKAEDWERWWKSNQANIKIWYQQTAEKKDLKQLPQNKKAQVLLLYRTIHPIFGYGRMPLLIHDAAWKKPAAPVTGKVWRMPLPSKQFAALLRKVQRSGFFQWSPNMGQVRDIAIYTKGRHRRVSIGMTRHLAFERLEAELLKIAKKAKLGLHFTDFFLRLDEGDLCGEGKMGRWAFRNGDVLPKRPWSHPKQWKAMADIEGTWASIRDVVRYLPSRTRLSSLDITAKYFRFASLLYGSRSQSRLTRERMLRSRRLHSFKLQGLNVIYLSEDKIEQMNFDLKRRALPQESRSGLKTNKRISIFAMLHDVWRAKTSKIIKFRVKTGKIHKMLIQFQSKDILSLLRTLARLASHSQGDRLLALRINQSGENNRDKFRLIVQMQWEMLSPIPAPKRLPHSLRNKLLKTYQPFTPVYR